MKTILLTKNSTGSYSMNKPVALPSYYKLMNACKKFSN